MLRPVIRPLSAIALATAVGLAAATPLVASSPIGEDAGYVVIVDPLNVEREYRTGDSASAFGLRLPEGAACPGDSANDGWRVQSFIVPAGTDIGKLVFSANRPNSGDPGSTRSLREVNGGIFTQRMTEQNEVTGQPGLIVDLPPFTFAYFETGTFPPGRYEVGVACTTPDWQVRRFWNAEIQFEVAPDVDPGGLRWTFLGDGAATDDESDEFQFLEAGMAGLIGLGALLVGLLAVRRRRVALDRADISKSREDYA